MSNPSPPPSLVTLANDAYVRNTKPPSIQFETRDVDPPSDVYVTLDDGLVFSVRNSVPNMQLMFRYRLLRADGTIIFGQQQFAPTADRTQNILTIKLTEGFILSVTAISLSIPVLRGQCFVGAFVSRLSGEAPQLNQYLFADYVTSGNSAGWPGGNQNSSVDESGAILTYNISQPLALANIVFGPPANARWRFISAVFSLVTSAPVGNRQVAIQTLGPAGLIGQSQAVTLQTASTTFGYTVAEYGSQPTDFPPNNVYINIASGILLSNGVTLQAFIGGSQGTDRFSSANVLVEEWIEATS